MSRSYRVPPGAEHARRASSRSATSLQGGDRGYVMPVQPVLPSRELAKAGDASSSLDSILQRSRLAGQEGVAQGGNVVQRAAAKAAAEGEQSVSPAIARSIDAARGGGRPLPHAVQRSMGEAFFGADFSGVRIHTGAHAHGLNDTLQAKAFATGRDIFFRDGAYDPASKQGQGILAHELTHTIQQGATGVDSAPESVQRASQSTIVQRLSMNDQPYPDLQPTPALTMRKSGGGSGGVYFADEGNESVVVKLESPGNAFAAQVANKFTAIGTGLRSSNYRILAPGSDGNRDVKSDILAHTSTDTRPDLGNRPVEARLQADGPDDAGNQRTAVILMEKMQNVSLAEMAQDPAQYDNIVNVLTNPQVIQGFAKLIISDAILGNGDRFMKDLAPDAAVPDIPANITNIFLSPDMQSVLAMDNESVKSGSHDHNARNADQNWSKKLATTRALLNPSVCDTIAEVVICAILYTQGDVLPPQDGTVPPNYHLNYIPPTGKLGPLHHKIVSAQVRNRMSAILAAEFPIQVEKITKTLRKKKGSLRKAYKGAMKEATGGTGTFANAMGKARPAKETVDYNLLRSRAKFLTVAKAERDAARAETKGIGAALKHLKHKEKKEG